MIAIPIRLRNFQKAVFVQKLQHAIPSIVVLGDGLDHLSHDPDGSPRGAIEAHRIQRRDATDGDTRGADECENFSR